MEHLVGKTLLSKGDLRMSKITMTTPLERWTGDRDDQNSLADDKG